MKSRVLIITAVVLVGLAVFAGGVVLFRHLFVPSLPGSIGALLRETEGPRPEAEPAQDPLPALALRTGPLLRA